MYKSVLAGLLGLAVLSVSHFVLAANMDADRVVSLQPAADLHPVTFKSDIKHAFKSIGHGIHHAGHEIHDFAKHTGRRIHSSFRPARHRR